jgi:8-oxo-dGTP diphosphatase
VTADELEGLPWVPADRAWLGDMTRALGTPA